jgi:hypothetical protein
MKKFDTQPIIYKHVSRAMPTLLRQSWKECKSEKERIVLRCCKLIASNLVDKALKLMKKHKINIKLQFLYRLEEDIEEKPIGTYFVNMFDEEVYLDPELYIDINFDSDYELNHCENFISVACSFSSFDSVRKLCKAGADPFIENATQYKPNIFYNGSIFIIPKILEILLKCNPNRKKSFIHYIYDKLRKFFEKNRFNILYKIILIPPCSNGWSKPLSKTKKIQRLHLNDGVGKSLLRIDLNNTHSLVLQDNLVEDNFYREFCYHLHSVKCIESYWKHFKQ